MLDITLYQIGAAVVHLHNTRWHGESVQSGSKGTALFNSTRMIYANDQYKPDSRSYTLDAVLVGGCDLSPIHISQRIKSQIGFETDIIGYLNVGCCGGGCACQHGGGKCSLMWVHARGVLRGVDLTESKNPTVATIRIKIEVSGYWRPLNRFFWRHTTGIGDHFRVLPQPASYTPLNVYPDCNDIVNDCVYKHMWCRLRYPDAITPALDPDLWTALANDTEKPIHIRAETWATKAAFRTVELNSDLWGAPLHSIYAFKSLPYHGQIELLIRRVSGTWGYQDETITIDLSLLDAALVAAGQLGIQSSDVLYVGDVSRLPGFILRNGQVINTPRPRFSYAGEFPGVLYAARGQFEVSAPPGTLFAYKHEGQRL